MPGIRNGDGISLDSTIAQHLAFECGQLLRHHEAPAHSDNAPQRRSNSPQTRDPRSRINRSIESPHGNVLFGDSFGAADPSNHRCCVIVDGNRLGCRLLGGSRFSKHDLRGAGLGAGSDTVVRSPALNPPPLAPAALSLFWALLCDC